MMISNKAYDVLKWIALIALDAFGTFYAAMSDIWHLPFGYEVCATCAATAFFLGTLLGISTINYNKSKLVDAEACYVQTLHNENELRDELSLTQTFENFDPEEEKEEEE